MTEANTLNNFNFGFSTYKSDILIHLSQWQYWWWFWFSLVWTLYFFIVTRIINKNTFQFNPVINTSIRGHGKWGDFLVAIIPLTWCGNILVNSNFILRMIEWQNESSLFTLRVQGKQWYWVYKFDASAAQSILTAPKNIGHNRWFISTPKESYCADSYYQALQLGTQLEYKQRYQKLLSDENITKTSVNQISNTYTYFTPEINFKCIFNAKNKINYLNNFIPQKILNQSFNFTPVIFFNNEQFTGMPKNLLQELKTDKIFLEHYKYLENKNYKKHKFYNNSILDDTVKYDSNILPSIKNKPLSFIKGTLNKHNLNILTNNDNISQNIFIVKKISKQPGALEPKTQRGELLWGFKQKKYKRIQKFKFEAKVLYDSKTLKPINSNPKNSALWLKSTISTPLNFDESDNATFNYQRAMKYNRHRGELVPVTLARRLLRTKRTLVLPAHVNITVITNSYDVVHSWFIPGLGLKLDCVPGRSTHHSFYIDNIGFYYGQCAEICGRYHHHMPIRICALPFEQFLIWWQKRGIKRLARIGIIHSDKKINKEDIKFRYNW